MNKMRLFRIFLASVVFCALFLEVAQAQSGQRYAEPVFDEVNVVTGVPYSSAIREGQTSPTTLYFDFYEPEGDELDARPLVITVFGGSFVAGSRDRADMKEYCTRFAKHGYVAASIDYRLVPALQISRKSLIRGAFRAAQDVSSAIRFLKAHSEEYRIDTSRMYMLGNSAGSIAILCELFMNEDERPAETFEDPAIGPLHSEGFEEYADFSPSVTAAVPQWGGVMDLDVIDVEEYVPICMLHGTDDNIVPYDSGYCFTDLLPNLAPYMYGSHAIAAQLDEIGITDYEFHSFEGEGHSFYFTAYLVLNDKFNTCFAVARDFLYGHLNFTTSMPEMVAEDIQVYPNPATDMVTISVDNMVPDEPFTITVVDVTGRKMLEKKSSSPQSTIDVTQWPSGVYFVRIGCNGFFDSRKIVKR